MALTRVCLIMLQFPLSISRRKNYVLRAHKQCFRLQYSSLSRNAAQKDKGSAEHEVKDDSDSDADLNIKKANDVSKLKFQILHAGLNFVPEYGWSKNSVVLGAQYLGLSTASHSLIQDGGADLVHYFNFLCNENLDAYLKEQNSNLTEKTDIQEYIENALENRLRMIIPFVSRWPEAMALMVSPTQFPSDLKNLLDLVDLIWSHSGSKSIDGTWYSKRISLAVTYKLCELSLVQDKSPEFSNSFYFLRNRVEMVMGSDQLLKQIVTTGQQFPEYGVGALITVRNILGLNSRFR